MSSAAQVLAALEDAFKLALRSGASTEGDDSEAATTRLAEQIAFFLREAEPAQLAALLQGGIFDVTKRLDHVTVAVTGMGWLGGGIPSVERTVIDLLASARREVTLTVYAMTPGPTAVVRALEADLSTGIRATVLMNRIARQHPHTQELLRSLLDRYADNLRVYDFIGDETAAGLHAKVLVVDRRAALVGSPNLTLHGMVSAHELAVVVRGPTAELIAHAVDTLLGSALVARLS